MIEHRDPKDFPQRIHIQTTNYCTSKCLFCPIGAIKNKPKARMMEWEICEKIINQCKGRNIINIAPFLNNEPLTCSYLVKFGEYVKEILPNTLFYIYTNGIGFTPAIAKTLYGAGVKYIHFSIGGATKKTYEKTFRVPYFNKVVRGILNFIKLNKEWNIPYSVNLTTTKYNQHEIPQFEQFWKSKGVVDIGVAGVVNRNRDFKGCLDGMGQDYSRPCGCLFNDLYITVNGDCCICCEDWQPQCVVGNIHNNTIEEIWNSKDYTHYRNLHLRGEKEKIPLCQSCNNLH